MSIKAHIHNDLSAQMPRLYLYINKFVNIQNTISWYQNIIKWNLKTYNYCIHGFYDIKLWYMICKYK
jgi:hypothetical protein